MNGSTRILKIPREMPSPVSPEQILAYGKRQSRSLQLEVNVIAYFGQLFQRQSSLTVISGITGTRVNRILPQ